MVCIKRNGKEILCKPLEYTTNTTTLKTPKSPPPTAKTSPNKSATPSNDNAPDPSPAKLAHRSHPAPATNAAHCDSQKHTHFEYPDKSPARNARNRNSYPPAHPTDEKDPIAPR